MIGVTRRLPDRRRVGAAMKLAVERLHGDGNRGLHREDEVAGGTVDATLSPIGRGNEIGTDLRPGWVAIEGTAVTTGSFAISPTSASRSDPLGAIADRVCQCV